MHARLAEASLLVSSFKTGKVFLLDDQTGGVLRTYSDPALINPTGMALSPDQRTLYVNDGNNNSVNVFAFDAQTAALRRTYATSSFGHADALAISNDGTTLYTGTLSGLYTFDTTTGASKLRLSVPRGPFGLRLSADGSTLYGSTLGSGNSVLKIATSNYAYSTFTYPQFSAPYGLALSPDGATLYAALENDGLSDQLLIAVNNASTGARTGTFVLTGPNGDPSGLDISPDGSTLYMSDSYNNVLYQLDTATGVNTPLNTNATLVTPSYVLYTTLVPEPAALLLTGMLAPAMLLRRDRRCRTGGV